MGFIVLLKPCLNLCFLKWLKPRRNIVNSFISIINIENTIRRRSSKLQKAFFEDFSILRISYLPA